ncbi:MAG TPA: hypothetical protein VL285_20820 [Bryobacteraceae bacterium]|jgi:hypothetical protein|nr:hypothetical protein [Bryobacteraceae bacterium]
MIDKNAAAQIMREVSELGLLTQEEISYVTTTLQPCHVLADGVKLADTLHLNIKVDDIGCLPAAFVESRGGKAENAKEGYVKYAFPGNVNVILSAINISQDDLIEARSGAKKSRPFLDHLGIDLRREIDPVHDFFDAIPYLASKAGWPTVSQGGGGKAVFCCHVQVSAKHWVYPRGSQTGLSIPLEFAYGPLVVSETTSGCDLRPADPMTVPAGAAVSSCGG